MSSEFKKMCKRTLVMSDGTIEAKEGKIYQFMDKTTFINEHGDKHYGEQQFIDEYFSPFNVKSITEDWKVNKNAGL